MATAASPAREAIRQQAAQMEEVFHALQAYEDSDAQRWTEIEEIRRLVQELQGDTRQRMEEWQARESSLEAQLQDSRGRRKQLEEQVARLQRGAEQSARALQHAQDDASNARAKATQLEQALAQARSSGNSRNQAMEGYLRQAVKEAEDMKVQAQLAKHEVSADVEAKLAEGRKAKEQVTQLVASVQRLRMRYGVVKEKLGRANDRLKRQQQDLRDARHTSQALAAEVRKAQDATRAAVTEARHRAREAANHHAFQIAQEVALREASEAKLVESYRALTHVRKALAEKDTLQDTLDLVYAGPTAALVDGFQDQLEQQRLKQRHRRRRAAEASATVEAEANRPGKQRPGVVRHVPAGLSTSKRRQDALASDAVRRVVADRGAGRGGVSPAPTSSRDVLSRIPEAVRELDVLLASVDAVAKAGEAAVARVNAANRGGGGGRNPDIGVADDPDLEDAGAAPGVQRALAGAQSARRSAMAAARRATRSRPSKAQGVGAMGTPIPVAHESLALKAQPMLT